VLLNATVVKLRNAGPVHISPSPTYCLPPFSACHRVSSADGSTRSPCACVQVTLRLLKALVGGFLGPSRPTQSRSPKEGKKSAREEVSVARQPVGASQGPSNC